MLLAPVPVCSLCAPARQHSSNKVNSRPSTVSRQPTSRVVIHPQSPATPPRNHRPPKDCSLINRRQETTIAQRRDCAHLPSPHARAGRMPQTPLCIHHLCALCSLVHARPPAPCRSCRAAAMVHNYHNPMPRCRQCALCSTLHFPPRPLSPTNTLPPTENTHASKKSLLLLSRVNDAHPL